MLPTDRFPRKARTQRGVTLIELMVVVAILGIIASVAFPAYTKYIVKAHRGAAQSYMMDLASRQGEMLASSHSYADKTELLGILPPPPAVSKNYVIDIPTPGTAPPTFMITATPVVGGKQAGDGVLKIDYAGVKEPAGKW